MYSVLGLCAIQLYFDVFGVTYFVTNITENNFKETYPNVYFRSEYQQVRFLLSKLKLIKKIIYEVQRVGRVSALEVFIYSSGCNIKVELRQSY